MQQNHRHRVLLVEDHPATRRAGVAVLEYGGFDVVVARDGVEALRRLAGAPLPCVVLLDLHMPRMDGTELRRALHADPRLAALPVVLWSADAELAAQAVVLGVAAVLRKSVDPDELLAVLAHHTRCPGPIDGEPLQGVAWPGDGDIRASFRSPTTTATPSGSPSDCAIPLRRVR
ncbi:MAG: response regulator [bacterium]|nr:response regulator [bacterium]